MMIVVNESEFLFVLGFGDVIELEFDVLVIGFGGNYVKLVVLVLLRIENNLIVKEIVVEVLKIVGDIDIYLNYNYVIEEV